MVEVKLQFNTIQEAAAALASISCLDIGIVTMTDREKYEQKDSSLDEPKKEPAKKTPPKKEKKTPPKKEPAKKTPPKKTDKAKMDILLSKMAQAANDKLDPVALALKPFNVRRVSELPVENYDAAIKALNEALEIPF